MYKKKQKENKIIIQLQEQKRTNIHKMNNLIKWSEIGLKSKRIKNILFKNKSQLSNIPYQLNLYLNQ